MAALVSQATAQDVPSKPTYISPALETFVVKQDFVKPPSVQPDYNKQVLDPLRASQALAAQGAAQAILKAKEVQTTPPTVRTPPTPLYTPQTAITGSCQQWMDEAGIVDQPIAILVIHKESGCSPTAVNPYSGACGIGQQLPCGKWPHAWDDPVGGLIDMQNYVMGKYGSWAAAWAHELAFNSY